jgi:uncharacterized membrane-anchored protein YjiN (DUF445 family)
MAYSYEKHPKEIIAALLKYHSPNTLKKFIDQLTKPPKKRKNRFIEIATKAYVTKLREDSTLAWAVGEVADKIGLREKTVHNHITEFRKRVKSDIEQLERDEPLSSGLMEVNDFIAYYSKLMRKELPLISSRASEYDSVEEAYKSILKSYGKQKADDSIPF